MKTNFIMICPICDTKFQNMGQPSHALMIKACYAENKKGYVTYDSEKNPYEGCIKFLEDKRYIITTETGFNSMGYILNKKTYFFLERGYCWCHFDNPVDENVLLH